MKDKSGLAVVGALLAFGSIVTGSAQNLVQNLTINLTAVNQTDTNSIKTMRVATKDVITYLNGGTPVSNGKLLLVTPPGNTPGEVGVDLNAFLRITSGSTVVLEVPTPDSFNLFQDFASLSSHGASSTTYAVNRISVDFNSYHSELQGYSVWHSVEKTVNGVDLSGSGSFSSIVAGEITIDGVTNGQIPVRGTVTVGAPVVGP
jgi:hypothetical protein